MDQNVEPLRLVIAAIALAVLVLIGVAVHAGAFLIMAPLMQKSVRRPA